MLFGIHLPIAGYDVVCKHADDILVTQVASAEVVVDQLLSDHLNDTMEAFIAKDFDWTRRNISTEFGLQNFEED